MGFNEETLKLRGEKFTCHSAQCADSGRMQSQKLEVVLKTDSKMELSPIKFEPLDAATLGSKIISTNQLENKAEYERVTVRAQVVNR